MDSENHNDSSNQREIRNNTVEAMDTEEGENVTHTKFLCLRFVKCSIKCYRFLCVRNLLSLLKLIHVESIHKKTIKRMKSVS